MVDAGYYVEVTSSQLTGGPIGIVPECKHPGFCLQPSGLQRTNPVWRPDSFQFADQPISGLPREIILVRSPQRFEPTESG